MAKIRLSFEITEEGRDNLLAIAKELGCYWSGKPSWRKMLTAIASLDLEVRKVPAGWMVNPEWYAQAQHPTEIPIQPPAWNAPMCQKSEFVTDRGDGTFVDTEEFEKPVPQKRIPGAVEAFAGIFGMKADVLPESGNVHVPSVSSNVEVMKNATKEQKIQAALAAMGSAIKRGSEL